MPYQAFKPAILGFASDGVHRVYARTRTALADAPTLDTKVFKAAVRGESDHYVNVVKAVASLSTVDQLSLIHI
eukprot:46811-Karenia_brevis.AAC.1